MADLIINFLPPGFQFEPTDEELITYFLYRKVFNIPCYPNIIPELDFHSTDPWNLNGKALSSKSGYYFLSRLIDDRTTDKGHWEEHQQMMDETVISRSGQKLGIKKYLMFFLDDKRQNTSIQTSWFMEEYHLSFGRISKKSRNQPQDVSEWVLCRVHDAKTEPQQLLNILQTNDDDEHEHEVELSFMDEVFLSMEDDQDEITSPN